jgi:hypothetical protein
MHWIGKQIRASAHLPFHRLCHRGLCLGLHRVAADLAGLRVAAVMPAVQGLLAAVLAKELPAAVARDVQLAVLDVVRLALPQGA